MVWQNQGHHNYELHAQFTDIFKGYLYSHRADVILSLVVYISIIWRRGNNQIAYPPSNDVTGIFPFTMLLLYF